MDSGATPRDPMVVCPACGGVGRIGGATGAVCKICWVRGFVERWRYHQLVPESGRAAQRREAAAESADRPDGPGDSDGPGGDGAPGDSYGLAA